MRAITRPGASDGLGQNLLNVRRRAGLTVGIHFGEIFPQLRRLFLPALIGEPWGFDGADADGFIVQHAASQQAFNGGFLAWEEIFGAANHGTESDHIMTDWIRDPQVVGQFPWYRVRGQLRQATS